MNKDELLEEIYNNAKILGYRIKLPNDNGVNIFYNAQAYTGEFFLHIFEKHGYKKEEKK